MELRMDSEGSLGGTVHQIPTEPKAEECKMTLSQAMISAFRQGERGFKDDVETQYEDRRDLSL